MLTTLSCLWSCDTCILVALINKALFVKALPKEHTCLTFTGSQWVILHVQFSISIGLNEEKLDYPNVPGTQAQGSYAICNFSKDQNHTKTILKACGCPDHQLNMEMIIVYKRYFAGYVIRNMLVSLIFVNMPWMCQNWAYTGQLLAGSICSALA